MSHRIWPIIVLFELILTYFSVKYFPEWVPGIKGFKKYARECKVLTTEIEYGLFNETKQNMVSLVSVIDG